MHKNYHFSIARLKECMLYVVVENVNLVTTNRSETETWQEQHHLRPSLPLLVHDICS